jgi:site-specific recombinase XerD
MTTNHVESDGTAGKSTRQLLVKIPNVSCLYRHSVNGTYYGIKKLGDKRKEHSLDTKDRKIAERKLAAWIKGLGKLDTTAEKTTLNQLIDKYVASRQGNEQATKDTDASIIKRFKADWKHGLDIKVSQIRTSHLEEWLAIQEGRLKNASYNRYSGFLKSLFDIAINDKMIIDTESPYAKVKVRWKSPRKDRARRVVPTQEQLTAIVNDVRNQKMNADAKDSADFLEFMGSAGMGQAETSSLTFNHIEWSRGFMKMRRVKTGELFDVPIYEWLKPLLERLVKEYPIQPPPPEAKVFKLQGARKALKAACKRLGYHSFSERNIRAALIRRLWQAKVDVKLISAWQGHQDGGKLIIDTYTEVFATDSDEYIKSELAKVK